MHYILGIFISFQINHVCDNFRPHGTVVGTQIRFPTQTGAQIAQLEIQDCFLS